MKRAFAVAGPRLNCAVTLCVCFCVFPSLNHNENPNRSETSLRERQEIVFASIVVYLKSPRRTCEKRTKRKCFAKYRCVPQIAGLSAHLPGHALCVFLLRIHGQDSFNDDSSGFFVRIL